jgi:mono/diheme cytochrome c family protein
LAASILVVVLGSTSCAKTDLPPYESNADRIYAGSVYYAAAGCANCHGVDWDGKGPDAQQLASSGISTTDFTKASPEKTPLDYFRAISDPTGYFAPNLETSSNKTEYGKFTASHIFHNMTDRARWAISNFLMSRAAFEGEALSRHKQALTEKMDKVKEIYADRRRWEIGYVPIAERPASPKLEDMLAGTAQQPVSEISIPSVSDARKKAAYATGTGADLYYTNCSSCHGNFAEGTVAGPRIGLRNIGEPIENDKGFHRRPMAFVSIRDLKGSSALSGMASFRSHHELNGDHIAGTFSGLTDDEWQELFSYTKKLIGQ